MKKLALVALVLGACGRATPPEAGYLEQEHAFHLRADQALSAGSPDEARDALLQAALLSAPPSMPSDEVEQLRRDSYARLSTLELARGRREEALKQAQRGLELGAGSDVFEAALFVARGQAHEALGHDAEAAADYHHAIQVDEALLAAELTSGEKP